MAFRTRRQAQYAKLIGKGFLPFEAQTISKVPHKTPYMPSVVRIRSTIFNKANKEHWSRARYERYIKDIYHRKGWTTLTRTGKETFSPWAMLRAMEDRYKDKHSEYTSPWIKKQKIWRDFQSKINATAAKYPAGKAYKTKTQEAMEKRKAAK